MEEKKWNYHGGQAVASYTKTRLCLFTQAENIHARLLQNQVTDSVGNLRFREFASTPAIGGIHITCVG
jgi:hypothetical protein